MAKCIMIPDTAHERTAAYESQTHSRGGGCSGEDTTGPAGPLGDLLENRLGFVMEGGVGGPGSCGEMSLVGWSDTAAGRKGPVAWGSVGALPVPWIGRAVGLVDLIRGGHSGGATQGLPVLATHMIESNFRPYATARIESHHLQDESTVLALHAARWAPGSW